MKRFNIEKNNLEFKNIISGPAPVGRILNYIVHSQESELFHINGYRKTNLENNIGCAWTTEFMLGLEIFILGSKVENKYKLILSDKGSDLYESIKRIDSRFNEGSQIKYIDDIRNILLKYAPDSIEIFEDIFRSSYPFKILKEYIDVNGIYYDRKEFIDDYFYNVKKMYDKGMKSYNSNARTTTGDNRVPSILQLCYFFNYISENYNNIKFNKNQIYKSRSVNKVFKYEDMIREAKKEEIQIKTIDNIVDKYGLDGNIYVKAIVRNSYLQQMFKHNLIFEFDGKCAICNLNNKELLIASHIKPSVECNVNEKIDINNGLLLCANHDKLFDRYLITFNPIDGRIKISNNITESDCKLLLLNPEFKLKSKYLTNKRIHFLKNHNLKYMEKENDTL